MLKKILIITQNFYPVIGSAGNRMKNLYHFLREKNFKVTVLTTEPAYPNKELYDQPYFWDDDALNEAEEHIIRVAINRRHDGKSLLNRLFFYVEMMFRFFRTLWSLRKQSFDYLYVSSPPIFIVFTAIIGKWLTKATLILEVRDLWPDSLLGVKKFQNKWIIRLCRWAEKMMYHQANMIVINSTGFAAHIEQEESTKAKKLIYLPNGARQHELTKSKRQDDCFRVVYTGNVGLAQNIDRLKKFAQRLHERNMQFDIVGYGYWLEHFCQFVNEQKLTNVHIHQPTTRNQCLQLIKQSDVAVAFLNDHRVFSTVLPGKLIDYMICQTPIVAGLTGVAADTIIKNNIGYVFPQQNVDDMIQQIETIKKEPALKKQLQQNCYKTVKRDYLWENNIENLMKEIATPTS